MFEFATAARIVFGVGVSERLAGLYGELGKRPLVLVGSDAGRHAGLIAGLDGGELWAGGVGEPDFARVREGVQRAREGGCDGVIAIGGGSVIDGGKAIAMLMRNGGDSMDYAEVIGGGRSVERRSAPFIAVPTTAGAGAEVTRNAVLRSSEHGVKVSLRSAWMLPAVALVDPLLTVGMPASVTASTGMDALSQVIEPFVSVRANAVTDLLCRDGARRIAGAIERVFLDGSDVDARGEMALGALYGGMALANGGLGAVHGFAAPIGGAFDAPHGAVCAALLGPVMRKNLEQCGADVRQRYAELARILTGRSGAVGEDGVVWVEELTQRLGVLGLGRYGVRAEDIPRLSAAAAAASSMRGNPVVFGERELCEILELAM